MKLLLEHNIFVHDTEDFIFAHCTNTYYKNKWRFEKTACAEYSLIEIPNVNTSLRTQCNV